MKPIVEFKLKQASAILGVCPKDLQNLVQLGVIRPVRRNRMCWFDTSLLLQAKVAFYLKESLGSSSELLAKFTQAISKDLDQANLNSLREICLQSRLANSSHAIEIKIPIGSLARDLQQQLAVAPAFRDLPRGRKRPGWKKEFLQSIQAAAADIGLASDDDIMRTIRDVRKPMLRQIREQLRQTVPKAAPSTRKLPEITVIARAKKKTA